MKRTSRATLILLGLVLLLGATVFAEVRREQGMRAPPLTDLDAAAIGTIGVGCNGCAPRDFEKISGAWWMRKPYQLPADAAALARLLAIAHAPVRSFHPAHAFDPAKIGLDPPQATIDFGSGPLAIGTTDAINHDRYVRVGDRIALVPDDFSPFLHESAESEIDRHLLPRGAGLLEVRIDDIARPALAQAWGSGVAQQIVRPESSADFAGTPIHVQLHLRDRSRIDYLVYRNGANCVALRAIPHLAYTLDTSQARSLLGSIGVR